MELEILYEDKNYIGFDKPSNIPTTYGKVSPCFVEFIKERHPKLFEFEGFKKEEGGLLYRLDNETSGLLLFAKNKEAFDQFVNDKDLYKVYIAKVHKVPEEKEGIINYPIVHKSSKKMLALIPGKKMTYTGKAILTETIYKVLEDGSIECKIKKGARHQIRVHLSAIGSPIIGDTLYGYKELGDLSFVEEEQAIISKLELRCVGIEGEALSVIPEG